MLMSIEEQDSIRLAKDKGCMTTSLNNTLINVSFFKSTKLINLKKEVRHIFVHFNFETTRN